MGNIIPSLYAMVAWDMKLGIVAWMFEQLKAPLSNEGKFYYLKLSEALHT
jgi:hypothetical protein